MGLRSQLHKLEGLQSCRCRISSSESISAALRRGGAPSESQELGSRAGPFSRNDRLKDKLGVDVATLRAILQVETAGAGFDAKKRLKLLFEPHIFYRQLGPDPKRNEAVKKGLAYAKARTRPYPPLSKRYDQIAAAIAIDETAALNSASWGLPQIMGFNHRAAGFQSAKAMVTSMLEGEGQQLEAFTNLLSDWKLSDALRNRDWRRFALKYNGPNALKHGYDKSLRAAFEKYSRVAGRAVVKPGTNKSFVFLSGF